MNVNVFAMIDALDDLELPVPDCEACLDAVNDARERLETLWQLIQIHADEEFYREEL